MEHTSTELNILIVCGSPEPSSAATIARAAEMSELIIAADRGLDYCLAAQVKPQFFCGDADTVSPENFARAEELGIQCDLHPTYKDDTDLGLAFVLAEAEAAARNRPAQVTLCCASGGVPDQALAVFGLMRHFAHLNPRMLEDTFEARILCPDACASWQLSPDVLGRRFSVLALSEPARVRLSGFEWDAESLAFGVLQDRGISNVVRTEHACITSLEGVFIAFLFT